MIVGDAHKLIARDMTEEALLTLVMQMAKQLGWRRYHVRNSKAGIVQGEVGFPDLVLVRGNRVLFIELKRENGKTTPEQVAWLEAFLLAGLEVYVWRPSDWLAGRVERILQL